MAPPFTRDEYADRLNRVRTRMQELGFDGLVIGDPANINWLTGYDAWSFYTPQIMVVGLEVEPAHGSAGKWMRGPLKFTTYLPDASGHSVSRNPGAAIGRAPGAVHGLTGCLDNGFDGKRIGYESDVYFLTPAAGVATCAPGCPTAVGRIASCW